jgi:plasmid replication initiation protein
MNDKEIILAQANALTQARYNFTVVEKRAVYYIIKEIRRQFINTKNGQKDLFNDLIIYLKTSKLQSSDTVLRDVYTSLKSLRNKSILIENDKLILEVGYINYFEHKKGESSLEVQVSHKILPYLVELAEQFTTYNLTVAITLKTKYCQRFYEYCSQFKNTGFFYITIEQLREKLMVKTAYPRYSLFKKYVIDVANRELKELYKKGQCDLYFNYTEDRAGRSVLGLRITIISKEHEHREEELQIDDFMFYIKIWLSNWLNTEKKPKNKAWFDKVIKHLQMNPDLIKKLYRRLEKLQKKEPSSNFAALSRHIIEEDYLK